MEAKPASRPPPRSPPPLSKEDVAVIRKKVSAPLGPPPPGLASFKSPKKYESGEAEAKRPESKRVTFTFEECEGEEQPTHYYNDEEYDEEDISPPQHNYRQREEDKHTSRRDGRSTDSSNNNTHTLTASSLSTFSNNSSNDTANSSGRDRIFNFRPILKATLKDLRLFVHSVAPPNHVIRCYIERMRSISDMMTPTYTLCADLEDGTGRELIHCRKYLKSRTSYYIFSLRMEDLYKPREQRSKLYLGKLRVVSDTEYALYNHGTEIDPSEDIDNDDEEVTVSEEDDNLYTSTSIHSTLYRRQLAVIQFNSRTRPCALDERGMEVCIAQPNVALSLSEGRSQETSNRHGHNLLRMFYKIRMDGRQNELYRTKCFVMHEKQSRYLTFLSCALTSLGLILSPLVWWTSKAEPVWHQLRTSS